MTTEPAWWRRYYHVKCWQPPQDERKWGRHIDFGVVARSALEAINFVSAEYPLCRIDAVNERGIVHHVLAEPKT